MNTWRMAAAAAISLAAGVALSQLLEPGVHVRTVTLAGDIPALQFEPAGPEPHPKALLAHGITASKETLFRLGEALSASGFICYSIDFPGHGASSRSFSREEILRALEEASAELGSVDVFAGHSMGAGVGAAAVREGSLNPRLFIAMGANPDLGQHGPPLLLLSGQFEEFVPPSRLRERTDAQVVISPWSDHALETFDPYLVNAATASACGVVGATPLAHGVRWSWRLTGLALSVTSALALGLSIPHRIRGAGAVLGFLLIVALALTAQKWTAAMPHVRRLPLQLATMAAAWLIFTAAGKLRISRWSFLALPPAVAIVAMLAGAKLLALRASLSTILLAAATLVGWLAAYRGTQRDGDAAMAVLVGYGAWQWILIL